MIDDVIACYASKYKESPAIHPDIDSLSRYDCAHETELVSTLYYYLLCDRSFNRCSEILNIHRSTFRYRLGIIRQIVQADFDDPDIRLLLLLSARIALASKEELGCR